MLMRQICNLLVGSSREPPRPLVQSRPIKEQPASAKQRAAAQNEDYSRAAAGGKEANVQNDPLFCRLCNFGPM